MTINLNKTPFLSSFLNRTGFLSNIIVLQLVLPINPLFAMKITKQDVIDYIQGTSVGTGSCQGSCRLFKLGGSVF